MRLKIGDKARVIKTGSHCQKIGTIVTITEVNNINYRAECPDMKLWYFHEDELKLMVFTKSDLKDGDVVTYRDGEKRIVCGNIRELKGFNNIGGMSLSDYNQDLIDMDENSDLDIIKVERPSQYQELFRREEKKEMTIKEIEKKLGYEVKIIKEEN